MRGEGGTGDVIHDWFDIVVGERAVKACEDDMECRRFDRRIVFGLVDADRFDVDFETVRTLSECIPDRMIQRAIFE